MKTYGNIWEQFVSFENLYRAAVKAWKHKRYKRAALEFNSSLEENLWTLKKDLVDGTYRPGEYQRFKIFDPKERDIAAAPFCDRVVHHAILNVLEPLWEPRFYYHSYACRREKGTHRAVSVAQRYLRKNAYVLKCDIEKYYPSIDHQILLSRLSHILRDERVVQMLRIIIDGSPPSELPLSYFPGDDLFTPIERRRGIPIGNLTSQFFANVYLDELDSYLKFRQGVEYYVRYMDDFLVFDESKQRLQALKEEIRTFLYTLRLSLHPRKAEVFPAKNGVQFLGYYIYRTHRRLRSECVRRFVRRMKAKQMDYRNYNIGLAEVKQSIAAWLGHAKHADAHRLTAGVLRRAVFRRGMGQSIVQPCFAGRVVEQQH